MRPLLAGRLLIFVVATSIAPAARADGATVPLRVEVDDDVSVTSDAGVARCRGPCTLHVAPGLVRVKRGTEVDELYVEGPSALVVRPGTPGVRRVGLGMLVGGAAIVATGLLVPLLACQADTGRDATGRTLRRNPCAEVSDGVTVGWIGGTGVGLTLVVVGAIVSATAGPRLALDPAAPVAVRPWLDARPGGLAAGGASFTLRF